MTKKQLMKIITEVVRKEVKKEVQKIFIKEETSNKLTDIIKCLLGLIALSVPKNPSFLI